MRLAVALAVSVASGCGSAPAPGGARLENRAGPAAQGEQAALAPAPRVRITCDAEATDASYAEIRALIDAGARGEPQRVSVCATATVDYGCSCPPFVFTTFYNGGDAVFTDVPTPYFLPVASGADPVDFLVPAAAGGYVLTGHFDGRQLTGRQWNSARRKRIQVDPEEEAEYWGTEAPVFRVESWCFEPSEEPPDYAQSTLDQMKAAGIAACAR